jgi:hypothetical protein
MDAWTQVSTAQDGPVPTDPLAGVLAGLIAGLAYLAAQMSLAATVQDGAGWEPLQRIAAILLGPDAAPPPADFSFTIAGMALLIHFPLAGIYGRVVAGAIRSQGFQAAALRGAAVGLAIFVVNFWLLAPLAFPWFEQSRTLLTALDHVLFGLAVGVCYAQLLRRPRRA